MYSPTSRFRTPLPDPAHGTKLSTACRPSPSGRAARGRYRPLARARALSDEKRNEVLERLKKKRQASLEAEAADLRAEVAALHADLLWLAGVDDETGEAPGFLSRGWLAAGSEDSCP